MTPDHINAIVEKFWAENPELKQRIFRSWYNDIDVGSSLNSMGKDAVALLLAKATLAGVKKKARARIGA